MKILLDTSIAIDLLRGDQPAVSSAFLAHKPRDVRISAIVVAELRVGAELSRDSAEGHRRINALVAEVIELPFDVEAAREFGLLAADLERRKLTKHVDEYDKLIAAHARSLKLRVATANPKDFDRLGVPWINWRNTTVSGG